MDASSDSLAIHFLWTQNTDRKQTYGKDGGRDILGSRGWHMNTAAAVAKSLQSCPTLCDPIDGSPPGSSVPGILQARVLEWVAMSSSRGSYWSRDRTHIFCGCYVDRKILYHWTIWEVIAPLVAGIEKPVPGFKRLSELICVKCLKHSWFIVSTQRLLDLIVSNEFLMDISGLFVCFYSWF